MTVVGEIASLWRYPVKSMAGDVLQRAYLGQAGVYGDRRYAFLKPDARAVFPWLTARELPEMLLYQPRFHGRNDQDATPATVDHGDLRLEVETPQGEVLSIDDPALADRLAARVGMVSAPALKRSEKAQTDACPVSLISLQTVAQLGQELNLPVDSRRFRANLYLDLRDAKGFAEDAFVDCRLQLGATAIVTILERDSRCKVIALDPESGRENREILAHVVRAHGGAAGVYGAVLEEGMVSVGDVVQLLD